MTIIMILLAVAGGAMLSIQAAINGQLGSKVGVFKSAFLTFSVGALVTGLLIFFFEPKHSLTLMDVPKWQLLGAMCLNKTAILPPDFCLMQTAHDPGSVRTADGIDARITEFAARIAKIQTVQK